ncbi:MAG: TrpB-like pyridoxal phosphate-dependent enzyme [Candidatus Hodarchaeales archaeon]|jgi:tryptophan synthase beta chain
MQKRLRIELDLEEIPSKFLNIVADLNRIPGSPSMNPPLHPGTKQPIGPADLAPLFPMELIKQEVSTDPFVSIPEEVLEVYRRYRPTPLFRAKRFEEALKTSAKIFYKYEGVSSPGSHKSNTAIAQAYYNSKEGIKKLVTETGAGQWGTALAYAGVFFDLDVEVFMVKVSYEQKPFRRTLMELYGAKVHPSPSSITDIGTKILNEKSDHPGSLGIAISEAIETTMKNENAKYSLGSVLNHVLLHQTVIGQETKIQLEQLEEAPDVVIGCLGGGSNFGGFTFPFIRDKLQGKNPDLRAIAVESTAAPKLTEGEVKYDFGDTGQMTPLVYMYTLGHTYIPAPVHAGGLRYHGAAPLVSHLLKHGQIEAEVYKSSQVFNAAQLFIRTEGIIPAPESAHAIASTIEQARKTKEEITIVFNLSGHGLLDLLGYKEFLANELEDFHIDKTKIMESLKQVPQI